MGSTPIFPAMNLQDVQAQIAGLEDDLNEDVVETIIRLTEQYLETLKALAKT